MPPDSVRRDPEYAWCMAELKKVLGLSDEFFKRSWAITDVHDSFTSMKVRGGFQPVCFIPKSFLW